MIKHLMAMGVIVAAVVVGIVVAVVASWQAGLIIAAIGIGIGALMALNNMKNIIKNPASAFDDIKL